MALHQAYTKYGIIEGIPAGNSSYTVFKGIPYAKAPIKDLRWKAPQPMNPWKGIYKANEFKGICPQQVGMHTIEVFKKDCPIPFQPISEDCLYMNIWTPANRKDEKLPVFFSIHGGANVTGYGHENCFDGEAFCKEGVILVTFSWRVNVFGWLVSKELDEENEHHVSGNYGILDQIACLKWVHENIEAFGGNPNNITIAGESAGASSVFSLCLSPLSKGLFKHAIMQSGGGYNIFSKRTYLSLQEMEEITDLHRLLGVNSIQEARELSDDEVERRINRPEALGAYLPMQAMDGYVFTDDFDTLCTNHQYHDVDILIGFTKDESFMYVYPEDQELFIQGIQQEYGDLANQYLSYCDFLEDEISFKKHLFSRNAELLKTSAILLAEDIEEGSTNNAYMYCFTRDLNDGFGAYHSCELWYEFQTLNRSCREFKGIDYELSKTMTKYWINFAKTGNPNGKGLPQWTPYTKEHPTMMELGEHVGMKNFGENERVKFRKEFLRKNTIKKW